MLIKTPNIVPDMEQMLSMLLMKTHTVMCSWVLVDLVILYTTSLP